MFVKCCGNGVEGLETGFCNSVVPTGEVQSCVVFCRPLVEYGSEVFCLLKAHAGVHFKEVFEIIGYSVSVGETLFFGNVSTE